MLRRAVLETLFCGLSGTGMLSFVSFLLLSNPKHIHSKQKAIGKNFGYLSQGYWNSHSQPFHARYFILIFFCFCLVLSLVVFQPWRYQSENEVLYPLRVFRGPGQNRNLRAPLQALFWLISRLTITLSFRSSPENLEINIRVNAYPALAQCKLPAFNEKQIALIKQK